MPWIDQGLLKTVFYIFPSKDQAEEGGFSGATGFLVGVQTEAGLLFLYAVTNLHAIPGAAPVYGRFNLKDGSTGVAILEEWTAADDDDLAVCLFPAHSGLEHEFVGEDQFLNENTWWIQGPVGAGDDVFMVGRFRQHQGQFQNLPVLRFGNISGMPVEPVYNEYLDKDQESYLVEMRSLSGFSGSPVFVFRMNEAKGSLPGNLTYKHGMSGPWLLGIDWCHFPIDEAILAENGKPTMDGYFVKSNTGMAGVIPVSRLRALLDREDVKSHREAADREFLEACAAHAFGAKGLGGLANE